MKKFVMLAIAGLALCSASAYAADTLSAEEVRKLLAGHTAYALSATGNSPQNYFAPDGKLYRKMGDKLSEGGWEVKDDGTHCILGLPGGCAKVVRNADGTHDRVLENGEIYARWEKIVKGKDF